MIATTGLSDTQWAWLSVAAVAVLAGPLVRAAVVEWRNTATEAPLGRLIADWPDDLDDVIVPGLGAFHDDGDDTWMHRPDDTVSWQGQLIPEAPARFTPRRIPVTTPAPAPALPAQLWGDLGPAIQPTPVFTVRVPADPRHVWIPAPMEVAS